jgi:hypothetical protein
MPDLTFFLLGVLAGIFVTWKLLTSAVLKSGKAMYDAGYARCLERS